MKKYYHFCLVCPNCHAPYSVDLPLESYKGAFRCTNPECQAYFSESFNIGKGKSQDFIEFARSNNISEIGMQVPDIPLFWEVKLNTIEESYVDWLLEEKPAGHFLITWPWSMVRFIPLLAFEYATKNPDKKIAIIEENAPQSSMSQKFVAYPPMHASFEKLAYLESDEHPITSDAVISNIKWFNKERLNKLIMKKEGIARYQIRINRIRSKEGSYPNEYKSSRHLANDLQKQLDEEYGPTVIRKKEVDDKVEVINEGGFIDIVTNREEGRLVGKLKYNKAWLNDVLLNVLSLRMPSKQLRFNIVGLNRETTEIDENAQLTFIPENAPYLDEIIKRIKPDFIIFQNGDYFIQDSVFGGPHSSILMNALKQTGTQLILIFSTKPSVRSYYNINNINRKYSIVSDNGIILHTWDSDIIMKYINGISNYHESEYSNPFSSRLEESASMPTHEMKIKYEVVPELDIWDKFAVSAKLAITDKSIYADIYKAVKNLKRSVLLLTGDETKPEVFKYEYGNSVRNLTYKKMLNLLLYQYTTPNEKYKEIVGMVGELYAKTSGYHSPLFNKVVAEIRSLIQNDESTTVTVVVAKYELKGAINLINEEIRGYMGKRLCVCSWDQIWEENLPYYDYEHNYVISVIYPQLGYSINDDRFDLLMLIGSTDTIEKMKQYIENRVNKTYTNPLHKVSGSEPAPKLLRDALNSINTITPEVEEALIDEVKEVYVDGNINVTQGGYQSRATKGRTTLKLGDNAILALDEKGDGMIIPIKAILLTRTNGNVGVLSISKNPLKVLQEGTEIIVDKHGAYTVRPIFIKYMLTHTQGIKFHGYGNNEWKDFRELYSDATKWIKMLEYAANYYSFSHGISLDEASETLAEFLSGLGLNAKGKNYIKGWWSNYDTLELNGQEYRIYYVERPKSMPDLQSIYNNINRFSDVVHVDSRESEIIYSAARTLQKLRQNLVNNNPDEVEPQYRGFRIGLEKEINDVVESASVFKVVTAIQVEIVSEVVQAFSILKNGTYGDLIKQK